MIKFLMIKGTYRRAWQSYLKNFSGEFKREFKRKIDEEQYYLRQYARPRYRWLNDQLCINKFAFNMSRKHFNGSDNNTFFAFLCASLSFLLASFSIALSPRFDL